MILTCSQVYVVLPPRRAVAGGADGVRKASRFVYIAIYILNEFEIIEWRVEQKLQYTMAR